MNEKSFTITFIKFFVHERIYVIIIDAINTFMNEREFGLVHEHVYKIIYFMNMFMNMFIKLLSA